MGMLPVIRRISRGNDKCEHSMGSGFKSKCPSKLVINGSFRVVGVMIRLVL